MQQEEQGLLFTVAIPTHNNQDTIMRSVQSALALKHDGYEIVVSDTSTNDATARLLEGLACDKLRVFRNDPAWSMWENHNFLLNEARGKYILFLHSDDLLFDDALQALSARLQKLGWPDRIFLSGESIYSSFKPHLERLGLAAESVIAGGDAVKLFSVGAVTPSGTLFSRDVKDIGGFIGNAMVLPYSDGWTELNCVLHGFRYYYVQDILYLRKANSTKLVEGTRDQVRAVYAELQKYFDDSCCEIIVQNALRQRSVHVLRHFLCDPRYEKRIRKTSLLRFLKHPFLSRQMLKLVFERMG